MTEPTRSHPDHEDVVVKTVRIAARPETVFPYFTDAERMTQWLAETVEVDPRPGGVCNQAHRAHDGKLYEMAGEYLVVDPPHRVAWTWRLPGPEADAVPDRVEVELQPDGDGTLLTLSHYGPRAQHEDHAQGWSELLARLVDALPVQAR